MKMRNFLKYLVPIVFSVLIASCSNDMQYVSAVSNVPNSVAELTDSITEFKNAFAELKNAVATEAAPLVQDMDYSFRCLWVVTKTPHGSDFLLARYDFFNNVWVTVNDHWGLRCAVTYHSKCYHVNAAGELYWVDVTGAYQKINTPLKSGYPTKALDIGAVYFDQDNDILWVLLKDIYGFRYVYTAKYPLTGANASEWTQRSVSAQGTLVRIATDPRMYPEDGNWGIGANSKGQICFWDPDGHVLTNTSSFKDVAKCGGCIIAIRGSTLYKGELPSTLASTGITVKSSVAMTELAGVTLALTIDATDHLNITRYDAIPVLP